MTSGNSQMAAGRSFSPPAFNLTSGPGDPAEGQELSNNPIQAKSEENQTGDGDSMFDATQLLKFLDHLDVVLDLKDALSPSLFGIVMKVKKIKSFFDAISDAKKGSSLTPGMGVKVLWQNSMPTLGSLAFAYKAIDTTYRVSVSGAKLLGRGVYAAQEFSGQISVEKYETLVDEMDDNVPDSLLGLLLSPIELFRDLRRIKRLSIDIFDHFKALKNIKKSLQNGNISILDVFKTVSDLKDLLTELVDLCKTVQKVVDELGFEFDLEPVEKAIKKFGYPLRSMKDVIGDGVPKAKSRESDGPQGGLEGLHKSLEPGYKPLLDSLPF